ncbi:MAG: META domain-containing protein [Flavobacteriales bacterium]|nr:META domain-containing protein [Flavobacteriales bacterium]
MEPLWDGYGSWRLVKVDFTPETQEQLRKQLGREKGEFSESKFQSNWNWIQRNIDNGHYGFFIGHVASGCVPEQRDSMELWPDRVGFRTGCNTCSGCAEVRDGVLTTDWLMCTELGCDIDYAIFYDLKGPIPIGMQGDTLVIGSLETRCIYYLTRLNGK